MQYKNILIGLIILVIGFIAGTFYGSHYGLPFKGMQSDARVDACLRTGVPGWVLCDGLWCTVINGAGHCQEGPPRSGGMEG